MHSSHNVHICKGRILLPAEYNINTSGSGYALFNLSFCETHVTFCDILQLLHALHLGHVRALPAATLQSWILWLSDVNRMDTDS